ncbi:MAG: aminopeptidase [Acidimicrobiia bacterium]|nr:aminopeptidase [Acidimicrobiia bacterium]
MPSSESMAKYADVAIQIGIGLEEGDRLLITSCVEAVELTRILVEQAYDAGASNVDVLWNDDAISRARFERGGEAASEVVSSTSRFRLAALEAGDRFLYVSATDPDALAGIDPQLIATFQKTNSTALEPLQKAQGSLERPWSVIAAPTERWAKTVFPGLTPGVAIESLWGAIFRACRVDHDDPVAAWRTHVADLNARSAHLTSRGYSALRYEAPGTDLRLDLPDRAVWKGGSAGGSFVPNLPTEEVFTAPHRLQGEGRVTATKPLSLFGNLIEGFAFEVRGGKIVEATARRGQDVLDQLLATDDGSVRFGETAMVPMSSAVAAEDLIWNNTLYDENDGCHIAIGRAYPISVEGGTEMTPDEQLAAGLNASTTHVDFVVGSPKLNVFGVLDDGSEEPIITAGEWGFAV